MGAIKAHEVARFIDRPDLEQGVFLAYGPDGGLVRETAARLARRFAGSDADGMNLVVLEGGELEAEPGRLVVEARTTSLFGDRRVVRLRQAGKALIPVLSDLASAPDGAVVVVEAGNLTPRDPLRAMVEGARFGRAMPCYPDTDEQLGRLIAETFSTAGIVIDPDAVTTLRDVLGNDREVTRRELDKLVLFAAETRQLSREDVLTLCADNAALVLDQIIDAMASGRAADLDLALERAFAANIEAQRILSTALLHFTTLRRWRTEVDAGKSPGAVLDATRPKPHFSRKSGLERQLRLWTDSTLAQALERLQQAVGETRKNYALEAVLTRRALFAICLSAAER